MTTCSNASARFAALQALFSLKETIATDNPKRRIHVAVMRAVGGDAMSVKAVDGALDAVETARAAPKRLSSAQRENLDNAVSWLRAYRAARSNYERNADAFDRYEDAISCIDREDAPWTITHMCAPELQPMLERLVDAWLAAEIDLYPVVIIMSTASLFVSSVEKLYKEKYRPPILFNSLWISVKAALNDGRFKSLSSGIVGENAAVERVAREFSVSIDAPALCTRIGQNDGASLDDTIKTLRGVWDEEPAPPPAPRAAALAARLRTTGSAAR